MKYSIYNQELGVDYNDSGRWRSYHLTSDGDSFDELVANAGIEEVDQDGGTLACYGLDDAGNQVVRASHSVLRALVRGRHT